MWFSDQGSARCRMRALRAGWMRWLWAFTLLLVGVSQQAQAQSFGSCDARMFLDQTNGTATLSTLYSVGYASTPFTYTSLGSSALARNGMGYNPLDNFIYGIEWGSFSGNELIRIAADGSSTNLGVVAGLPSTNYNNGAISPTGDYYLTSGVGGTNLYRVNIVARTAATVTMSQSITVADLAWHNGLLYGVDSNLASLVSIDPVTGVVTVIGSSLPLSNAISMWGFTNGLFANGGGSIYAIDPATGRATLMSTAPGSSNADGANCANAAIAFDADLTVTKTNTPAQGANDLPSDTYVPGAARTYTIVVRNGSGSFGAQNITVSDPVPAGINAGTVSWTCAATSGGAACGAASGSGALNDTGLDLPPGAVATYTVTMTVPSGFTGPLVNTVTVTPPNTINDTDLANNTATDTDQPAALVTISKVSVGGTGAFGFTGSNGIAAQTLTTTVAATPVTGAAQALTALGTATTITEGVPPAGYALTGISCSGLPGGTATPDLAARTVTLDAAATASGANITCTFTNTRAPQLRLQKSLPNGRAVASDQFTLNMTGMASVTTAGTGSTATGVLVHSGATAGASYTLSETAAGATNLAFYTSSYSCSNTLPGGQTPSGTGASFVVTPVTGDDLTCTITNAAVPGADLQIVKTASAPVLRRGDVVSFTLTGRNNGPGAANGAVIRDAPGAGLDCATPSPTASCSASGGAACPGGTVPVADLLGPAGVTIPVLPAGGSVVITLQCLVTATGLP